MSERCSGEMELFSDDESRCGCGCGCDGELVDARFACSAGSTSSDSVSADMVVLVIFRLWGLTTGDWRTARGARGLAGFRPAPMECLRPGPVELAGGGRRSMFISEGEPADTSAREVEYIELYSVWACRAGELSGLK
jgi:hypothetical protein